MLNNIIQIAKKAGKEIMEIYQTKEYQIVLKQDESPVTIADTTSHNIISNELKKISPYPIFSEEDIIPYEQRKNWEYFWLVDPLDGTKDFIAKNGQFTINIALIHKYQPILGVVYAPATNDIYYAQKGEGAFKNGALIYNHSKRAKLIAADSNFYSTQEMQNFFKKHNIEDVRKIGSSLKICQLAEGTIDVYPRLNETKEWDTAATQIIANEAGCKLIDITTNEALTYNKQNYRNPYFIASRNDLEFIK